MTDASNEKPEPFNLSSDDVAARKRADFKRLFPEVFNEDKIDIDALRRVIGDWVDEGTERFGLNWSGKAACMKVIQTPATGALLPDRDESVNFDESENVFIEGDNLEVLKLLQKAYFGKIKMIYIDPPYNKGKDFIYPDNYSETLETYLRYTNQADEDGSRLTTNVESSGRFHSKWLSMMMPRLYLAKNLLSDDGVIFISIDDSEQSNLRKLCDLVFGEENFVALLPTIMNLKGNHDNFGFSDTHEYTLVYAKLRESCVLGHYDIDETELDEWEEDEFGIFKRADTLRRTGQDAARTKRPKGWFPVFISKAEKVYATEDDQPVDPSDITLWPVNEDGDEMSWSWGKTKINDEPQNLVIVNGRSGKNIYKKQRPKLGELPTKKPKSIFYRPEYSSSTATTELKNLLGKKVFEGPKPVPLLTDFVKIGAPNGGIILDFFAGSGTCAQAVLKCSAADGIKRNFICVQLPEKTLVDSDANAAGYATISELTRDRIRKALDSVHLYKESGFRSFRLAESSFSYWNTSSQVSADDLLTAIEKHTTNIDSATDDDILFEILLKDGFALTTKVESVKVAGGNAFSVADGALLICLERNLEKETIDALTDLAVEREAARIVCLDAGFQGSDQLKTNAVQTFKSRLGHGEDGSMFRTV